MTFDPVIITLILLSVVLVIILILFSITIVRIKKIERDTADMEDEVTRYLNTPIGQGGVEADATAQMPLY